MNHGESTAFKLSWLGSVASQAILHVKEQNERRGGFFFFLLGNAINPKDGS